METQDTFIDDGRDHGAVPVGVDDVGAPFTAPSGDGVLPEDELRGLRFRWQELQARFADDPRGSVELADALVTEVQAEVAERFATERERLDAVWDAGDDPSEGELHEALGRYRSFFRRILTG